GFALRLTFGRRMQTQGSVAAYGRMVRRLLGLVLVSLVIYTAGPPAKTWIELTELGFWGVMYEPLKRTWFQTLMHIAVTSLWLLPVIRSGAGVRIGWMVLSAVAHVLLSYGFNYVWVNTSPNAIDGGPLGFLTWAIPAIVGTLACDLFLQPRRSANIAKALCAAIFLMSLGYAFSCGTRFYDVAPELVDSLSKEKLAAHPVLPSREQIDAKLTNGPLTALLAEPPFVPPPDEKHRKWNYWMMSQRGGTLSYLTFCAGFSLAVYVLFYLMCDVWGWRLGVFRTFGTNALFAYILHGLVGGAVKPFIPRDAPAWYALSGLALFFAITWLMVRHFEKQGVYLRA
ncbi:MAG: hypothetical protein V4719_28025, partial [Planctomycetota bacterium]